MRILNVNHLDSRSISFTARGAFSSVGFAMHSSSTELASTWHVPALTVRVYGDIVLAITSAVALYFVARHKHLFGVSQGLKSLSLLGLGHQALSLACTFIVRTDGCYIEIHGLFEERLGFVVAPHQHLTTAPLRQQAW